MSKPTLAQWKDAESWFKGVMNLVKHDKGFSIAEKAAWVGYFPEAFPFATSFARQLCEALELAKALEKFPQFDETTPRYSIGDKLFFMQIEDMISVDMSAFGVTNHYIKRATYTDSDTGVQYGLSGHSWEKDGRIHIQALLDGNVVHKADYLQYTDSLMGMNRYQSSQQLISAAFSAAENALFVQLNLLPF